MWPTPVDGVVGITVFHGGSYAANLRSKKAQSFQSSIFAAKFLNYETGEEVSRDGLRATVANLDVVANHVKKFIIEHRAEVAALT